MWNWENTFHKSTWFLFEQLSCSYYWNKCLYNNHVPIQYSRVSSQIITMFDFTFWSRKWPLIHNPSNHWFVQCLILPSGVENGLLSTIPQRWHDLDRSQLWQQGSVINQHCQNILKQSKSKILPSKHGYIRIFQYFPYLLSTLLSSFGITNILCKYNLKTFPFQCFQSPPKSQLFQQTSKHLKGCSLPPCWWRFWTNQGILLFSCF